MKPLLLTLLICSPLHAFCVLPADHTGAVRIASTEIVIVHRAAREGTPAMQDTLVRITPVFDIAPPPRLGWVIPLAADPTSHGIADVETLYDGIQMHSRLFRLAQEQWASRTEYEWPEALTWLKKREPPALTPADHAMPTKLELAGPLLTTAIKGEDAVAMLQSWLAGNGLQPLADKEAQWYSDNGYSFLCVLVQPRDGQERLGAAIELPPIRFRMQCESPTVPLANGGSPIRGRVDLAVISDTPLDTNPYLAFRDKVQANMSGYVLLLNLWSLRELPGELGDGSTVEGRRWYANRVETSQIPETTGQETSAFVLTLGDLRDELPGFWYYGDKEISFVERFFREHILAVTTSVFFVGLLALIIKARRNRRMRATQ